MVPEISSKSLGGKDEKGREKGWDSLFKMTRILVPIIYMESDIYQYLIFVSCFLSLPPPFSRINSSVIIVNLLDKRKNCKRLLQWHMIFYEETFSSKIKNIDSSFSKLVYSFHSTYQEREIEPSMKREKSYDYRRVKSLGAFLFFSESLWYRM